MPRFPDLESKDADRQVKRVEYRAVDFDYKVRTSSRAGGLLDFGLANSHSLAPIWLTDKFQAAER